jgi:predicted transposase/invertase (TIGR01784 family)
MKVKIANPIYDAVFKFLMEDKQAAKILLSDLLQQKIIDLEVKPKEYSFKLKLPGKHNDTLVTVYRLDFKATVVTTDGKKNVLIEVQKARLGTELARFRAYLGEQYANFENIFIVDGQQKALPIITIYFLGYTLSALGKTPIVRTIRTYTDHATGKKLNVYDDFIEALTHDTIVVQLPVLKQTVPRNEVEQALLIFEPTPKQYYVEIDENLFPEKYKPIIKRLKMAAVNPQIYDRMKVEEEILLAFKLKDQYYENTIKKEREARLKALKEKEKEREARLAIARNSARELKQLGVPVEKIAQITGLSIDEIRNLN